MPKINGRLEMQQDVSWIINVENKINVLSAELHLTSHKVSDLS